jgi:hypothetical protein
MVKLASRPLDLQVAACLALFRARDAIVVVMDHPAEQRRALIDRLNRIYPF